MGNYIYSQPIEIEKVIEESIKISPLKIKSLVCSGGGVLGIGLAGAISELYKLGVLELVENFVGSSVGSIIITLCSIKATPEQIHKIMNFDFKTLLDDDYGIIRDTSRLYYEFGYYKGDLFQDMIENFIFEISGINNLTFIQHYKKYNTKLIISITHVYKTKCICEYVSYVNSPNVKISEIIRKSCTYPLVFRSLSSTSDGGILDNFPMEIVEEDCRLGIKLVHKESEELIPVENVIEYMSSIISSLHSETNKNLDPIIKKQTIEIKSKLQSTNFNITDEQKIELYNKGVSEVKKYFLK